MTVAMKMTGRQRRVTPRNTTTVAADTMRIALVAPRLLKIRLQRVRAGVRWAANHCGIVRSPSTLPFPALVTSSPNPTTMPRISTQAIRIPAAMRPRWLSAELPVAGSGWAGRRSARASGSSPSVTGSITGSAAARLLSSKAKAVTPSQVIPSAHAPTTSDT